MIMAEERESLTTPDDSVCAVVVTYQPDPQMVLHLDSLTMQVAHVIVVDNASDSGMIDRVGSWAESHDADLLLNRQNLGVAAALNQGFALALAMGYEYVLALDQDSQALPEMVHTQLGVYRSHPRKEHIAIVAPQVEDPEIGIRNRYLRSKTRLLLERVRCNGQVIDRVSNVISSGGLFSLKAFREIGPFREDYFIDYVDTEYCLRARREGYEIVVACGAHLAHKWGSLQRVRLGRVDLHTTFHTPQRWYYISRNRIPTAWMYGLLFPNWLLFDLMLAVWWVLRMLLFEDKRMAKLAAILRGTMDGFRGKMGPLYIE